MIKAQQAKELTNKNIRIKQESENEIKELWKELENKIINWLDSTISEGLSTLDFNLRINNSIKECKFNTFFYFNAASNSHISDNCTTQLMAKVLVRFADNNITTFSYDDLFRIIPKAFVTEWDNFNTRCEHVNLEPKKFNVNLVNDVDKVPTESTFEKVFTIIKNIEEYGYVVSFSAIDETQACINISWYEVEND